MTPRAALTKHLLDGDDSFFTGNFEKPVNGAPPTLPQPGPAAAQRLTEGPAPFDADAT